MILQISGASSDVNSAPSKKGASPHQDALELIS